jgi:hypothetical protein
MARSARALTISPQAASLRHQLGPLAWFVLEELALCADRCDGALRARVGVRDLAAALGISKDTAARAVGRLIDAGLSTRVVGRSGGGRFTSGHYELQLPTGIALADQPNKAEAEPPQQKSTRTRAGRSGHHKPRGQLTLIDHSTAGNG